MFDLSGRDRRLDLLAGRVEVLLYVVVPVLAVSAYRSTGLERLLLAPTAVVLLLMALLHRFAGVPGHVLLRWLAGGVGMVLALAGLGGIGVGVWMWTLGSFAILLGLVLVPVGVTFIGLGYSLLMVALNAPPKSGAAAPGAGHPQDEVDGNAHGR